MHKSTSPAFFVFGAFFMFPAMELLVELMSNKTPGKDGTIASICCFIVGSLLIIGGICRMIYTNNYNKQLDESEGSTLSGVCHNCDYSIVTQRKAFRGHRNFREGFIYCPSCKKPISIRKFKAEK